MKKHQIPNTASHCARLSHLQEMHFSTRLPFLHIRTVTVVLCCSTTQVHVHEFIHYHNWCRGDWNAKQNQLICVRFASGLTRFVGYMDMALLYWMYAAGLPLQQLCSDWLVGHHPAKHKHIFQMKFSSPVGITFAGRLAGGQARFQGHIGLSGCRLVCSVTFGSRTGKIDPVSHHHRFGCFGMPRAVGEGIKPL